jgi:FKBP-type peptidyl-prolyl cis-trans isomerase FkpA
MFNSVGDFMFKTILCAAMIAVLGTAVSCTKPKTDKDKISYTIGVQFGKNLKAQDVKVDSKMLGQGVADAMNGKPQMTDEEMQATMMKMNEERQKEQAAEGEKNKKIADEFLAKHKTAAPDIKSTPSGLQYKMITEGTGPAPKETDTVSVHYKGTLLDGTEFDSSYKRNQPAEFPLKGVIPGWTEALQLMKKGGKATLWIPPQLAYGDRSRPGIPANSVLVFDVELLDVKTAAAPSAKKVIK